MLTSRLAGGSHLSLLPWKNGLDSHSPGAAYNLWYVPVSLSTDNISGAQKRVDAPVGRQEHIVIFQRGALRPLGPTIYPQEAGSERWVCLIFRPSVFLIRKYFSIRTSTYLSNSHLIHQTSVPPYPPCRTPLLDVSHRASNRSTIFSPTFITLLVARGLDPAAHVMIQENYLLLNLYGGPPSWHSFIISLTKSAWAPSDKLVSFFIIDLMGSARLSIGVSTSHSHLFIFSYDPPFSLVIWVLASLFPDSSAFSLCILWFLYNIRCIW